MEKGLLRQILYLQSQLRDSENLNGVWKLKRLFCITCIELIFKFLSGELCFQFEVFIYSDFQMDKTHLKSFVFQILFIGDYSSTPYLFDDKV